MEKAERRTRKAFPLHPATSTDTQPKTKLFAATQKMIVMGTSNQQTQSECNLILKETSCLEQVTEVLSTGKETLEPLLSHIEQIKKYNLPRSGKGVKCLISVHTCRATGSHATRTELSHHPVKSTSSCKRYYISPWQISLQPKNRILLSPYLIQSCL